MKYPSITWIVLLIFPVSYTHLDVYKRQHIFVAVEKFWLGMWKKDVWLTWKHFFIVSATLWRVESVYCCRRAMCTGVSGHYSAVYEVLTTKMHVLTSLNTYQLRSFYSVLKSPYSTSPLSFEVVQILEMISRLFKSCIPTKYRSWNIMYMS